MDAIKTEPEVDPLSTHTNDVIEEKKPLTEGMTLLDFDTTWIKKECVDQSYDATSEIKFEETGMSLNPSPIKSEAEEDSCDVDIVREEPKFEEMAKNSEVSIYSIAIIRDKRKTVHVITVPQEEHVSMVRDPKSCISSEIPGYQTSSGHRRYKHKLRRKGTSKTYSRRQSVLRPASIPEKKKPKTCYVPDCMSSNRKDPDLTFFHFPKDVKRVQQWTERLGIPYTEQTARKLYNRVVCSHHFSETDFKTKEKKGLNWLAVPSLHGSTPITHPSTQPNPLHPSSFILPTTLILPENKPTQLSSETDLKFLQPSKTYRRKSLALRPLSFTKQHTPILPEVDDILSVSEPSSTGSVTQNACDREEGNINIPYSVP